MKLISWLISLIIQFTSPADLYQFDRSSDQMAANMLPKLLAGEQRFRKHIQDRIAREEARPVPDMQLIQKYKGLDAKAASRKKRYEESLRRR